MNHSKDALRMVGYYFFSLEKKRTRMEFKHGRYWVYFWAQDELSYHHLITVPWHGPPRVLPFFLEPPNMRWKRRKLGRESKWSAFVINASLAAITTGYYIIYPCYQILLCFNRIQPWIKKTGSNIWEKPGSNLGEKLRSGSNPQEKPDPTTLKKPNLDLTKTSIHGLIRIGNPISQCKKWEFYLYTS